MATPKHQRVFIWTMAIAMALGTLGMYASIILANDQGAVSSSGEADLQRQVEEFQKQQEEAARASAAASGPLDGYKAEAFNADDVTSLQKTDLKSGDGDTLEEGDKIKVSYFGWTPDGEIFDSTTKNDTNNPVEGFTLQQGSLIEGWVKGLPGMKEGGVRKLVIPADLAYGATGSPPNIAPNTPLTFIVRLESIGQ